MIKEGLQLHSHTYHLNIFDTLLSKCPNSYIGRCYKDRITLVYQDYQAFTRQEYLSSFIPEVVTDCTKLYELVF